MEKMLSAKQVAEVLGVHPETINNWIREGRLPVRRLSKRCNRIPESALATFGSSAPAPEPAATPLTQTPAGDGGERR